MEKELGFIDNEEQFLDVDEEICPIDNSIKALEVFKSIGVTGNITVLPCSIEVKGKKNASLLFWVAFDESKSDEWYIIDIFKIDDRDKLDELDITSLKNIDCNYLFSYNNQDYCITDTSTGNFVIKKLNGLWTEDEVNAYIKINNPDIFNQPVYPVELFSKSKHRFITAVWIIEDSNNEMFIWFPINWDDFDLMEKFPTNDIEMFPLNIGDVTRAGNVILELKYNQNYGFYFEKTSKPLSDYHLAKDLRNLKEDKEVMIIPFTVPKYTPEKHSNDEKEVKCIPLFPKTD